MSVLRLLIVATILAVLAGNVGAEEFWGRKLSDQPVNFIFGYGSLINSASRNATANAPIHAIPVRVSAAFGYIRSWNERVPSGFTALGLRRPEAGENTMTINGVLYPVQGNDMAAFDAREAGYARVELPRADIEALSWERLPEAGQIWVYVPHVPGNPPGVGLEPPSATFPILQSYVDVVIEGGLEYGPDFAREIIETTKGWSPDWLNDRDLARRPWVFAKNYNAVDKLLAASAPYFADRLYSEPYAVKRLMENSDRLPGRHDMLQRSSAPLTSSP
ncbi:MAG TPA: gamma-glutamylcyclotransferase family protein [Acetobacteraceae bacterium]|nr:gamma-glutamylcyclotransferase family protein [Acetobacteraceae bacterium]